MYKLVEKNRINDTVQFQIELQTLTTQEYTINYDITNAKISGNVIRYGGIETLTAGDCIDLLEKVLSKTQLKKLWNTSIYRNATNAYWFATWFKDSAYTKEKEKIEQIINAGVNVDRNLAKFVNEMVELYNFEKYYGYKSDYIKALKKNYSTV